MKKHLPFLSIIASLIICACSKENGHNISSNTTNGGKVSLLAGNGGQGSNNGTGNGASFFNPTGIAADTLGNVYVADYRNNLIRKISNAGVVTTLAGTGSKGAANGLGIISSFYQPTGVAVDISGNVYVADCNNNLIRKISPSGVVSTIAGTGTKGSFNGIANAATFNYPQGVAVDASGNVYMADYGNNQIREISPAGMVTTLAGQDSLGNNNGAASAAAFNQPTGVAVDAAGNVYVADFGNNLVRKISAGSVTTLAGSGAPGSSNGTGATASFNGPAGIAVDAAGNVYVADYGNNILREISPSGVVSTLGTGSGSSAKNYSFSRPYGVAVDAAGNIYVAVYGNSTIQKISK